MSTTGAFIHIDRQQRKDAKRAAKQVIEARFAERVAVRELVEAHGILNDKGDPCPWAIQQALRLRRELGPEKVTKAMVVKARDEKVRKVREQRARWAVEDAKGRKAA